MGTKFWEVVCGENGIGGGSEYCGDKDAVLGRVNVFYHEASGGKPISRAVLIALEPGVIGAATLNYRRISYNFSKVFSVFFKNRANYRFARI
jgi:hypothetical protein